MVPFQRLWSSELEAVDGRVKSLTCGRKNEMYQNNIAPGH